MYARTCVRYSSMRNDYKRPFFPRASDGRLANLLWVMIIHKSWQHKKLGRSQYGYVRVIQCVRIVCSTCDITRPIIMTGIRVLLRAALPLARQFTDWTKKKYSRVCTLCYAWLHALVTFVGSSEAATYIVISICNTVFCSAMARI